MVGWLSKYNKSAVVWLEQLMITGRKVKVRTAYWLARARIVVMLPSLCKIR